MPLATILMFVGAGFVAYKGFQWWDKRNKPPTVKSSSQVTGTPIGRSLGLGVDTDIQVSKEQVLGAAHDDMGSNDTTNVYDAVIGIGQIVGGVVQTGIGKATGDVEDDTSDVVDKVATFRAEEP